MKVGAQPLDLTGRLHTQKSWVTNRPVGGGIWRDCCTRRSRPARPTSLFTETFCFQVCIRSVPTMDFHFEP